MCVQARVVRRRVHWVPNVRAWTLLRGRDTITVPSPSLPDKLGGKCLRALCGHRRPDRKVQPVRYRNAVAVVPTREPIDPEQTALEKLHPMPAMQALIHYDNRRPGRVLQELDDLEQPGVLGRGRAAIRVRRRLPRRADLAKDADHEAGQGVQ